MDNLTVLMEKMAIEELMADYWWYMDNKAYDDMLEKVFAADMCFFNAMPGMEDDPLQLCDTAEGWVEMMHASTDKMTTAHHGHQHKIVLTADDEAHGRFILNDHLYTPVDDEEGVLVTGCGFYVVDFKKYDGRWRIQNMRLGYLFMDSAEGTAGSIGGGRTYPGAWL